MQIIYPLLVDCSYLPLYTHAMMTPFVLYLILPNCTLFHYLIESLRILALLSFTQSNFFLTIFYTFAMATF